MYQYISLEIVQFKILVHFEYQLQTVRTENQIRTQLSHTFLCHQRIEFAFRVLKKERPYNINRIGLKCLSPKTA